jgi:hypothetical protein
VDRLRDRGFDPRKVGPDSWDARCPVHRCIDHALANLTRVVGKKVAASARWPKTVPMFAYELRRLAPQLRLHGLFITFEPRHEGRFITMRWEAVPTSQPTCGTQDPETT